MIRTKEEFLARVESGDLTGASRDVQDGLDLMESMGVGAGETCLRSSRPVWDAA